MVRCPVFAWHRPSSPLAPSSASPLSLRTQAQPKKLLSRRRDSSKRGVYNALVDGLRDGLRPSSGWQEGRGFQFFEVREAPGDVPRRSRRPRGRFERREGRPSLHRDRSSVTARRQAGDERGSRSSFSAGTDPVSAGLVDSYAQAGRKAHRDPQPGDRSDGEAARDPQADRSRHPTDRDLLRPRQPAAPPEAAKMIREGNAPDADQARRKPGDLGGREVSAEPRALWSPEARGRHLLSR